jgi:hypothetical protein
MTFETACNFNSEFIVFGEHDSTSLKLEVIHFWHIQVVSNAPSQCARWIVNSLKG